LDTGDAHTYRVTLAPGQFMRARLEQRGIDVLVTLYNAANDKVLEVDTPGGAWGTEILFFEARQGGSYTIEVRARQTTAPPGRYRYSLETGETATVDKNRLAGERAFAVANQLVMARTPVSSQRGIEKYAEAARLFHAANYRQGEIGALLTTGVVQVSLGQSLKALNSFNETLGLQRNAGMRGGEAMTLGHIAQAYQSVNDRKKALDYFNQALQIFRAVNDDRMAAYTLLNTGSVYDSMGESQKALYSFGGAVPLFQSAHDRRGEADALNKMGLVYDALGDRVHARAAYARALSLFRNINDCSEVAPTLSNQALDMLNSGDTLSALGNLNQALMLQRGSNDRKGEATTLNNIGYVYLYTGETQKAIEYLQQALTLHREVGNREGEGDSLSNLMLTWKSLSKQPAAIFYGKGAVTAYQEVRSKIPPLDKEAQKSFLKSKGATYHELADLLLERGRLLEAQQVLGLLKEDEYYQFVRRDAGEAASRTAPAAMTEEEQELADRYREMADKLAALGKERAVLVNKAQRTPEEQRRLLKLEADLNIASLQFQKYIEGISNQLGAASEGSQRAEQLKDPKSIINLLRTLGPGTVALYTFVSEQKYNVILVTPDVQIARDYPIGSADLYKKVLAFRELLANPGSDPRPLAQELYNILVGPIANDLKAVNAETLMWSLDGVLRYIPVAALYDGQQYMVERYRNTVFTPISTTRLTDQPRASWEVLGFGASKPQPGFMPLAEVPQELRSIIREENSGQPGGVLPGRIRLDESFTKAELDAELQQNRYAVVHIASHFKFEPGNETKSFLLLGDGSRLTLDQLRDSPDYFRGVELLTLSACNTATSGTGADGKEVEGFAVLAQRQGAGAVLASLWPVTDASTRLLMQKFYQIRGSRPGMLKAEALRQAQIALLRGEVKGPNGQLYSHPNFWASFILMGNWR
jgi:CHAT domain-containing protein